MNPSLSRDCYAQVCEHPGDGGRGARPHHHGGARPDRSAGGESPPLSSSSLRYSAFPSFDLDAVMVMLARFGSIIPNYGYRDKNFFVSVTLKVPSHQIRSA